jgi:sarcosine oxidase
MQSRTVRLLPALNGPCIRATACLYTCTPDFGFVIDTLPDHPQILIASPCSGHGFKHSAAIGESLAQLTLQSRAALDLTPFQLARFTGSPIPSPLAGEG